MKGNMKIGIFDSGLGGLIIARAIRKEMSQYDYVYFGDTKRVPYGDKPQIKVLAYTKNAVDYLLRKENCALIVVACNTASARALRKIQMNYLPKHFPDRKVLGVLIPGAEEASKYNKIGVIATEGTIASKTFPVEIKKLNKGAKVFQNAAPMLVPLIEKGNMKEAKIFLAHYVTPLKKKGVDTLVLGCTHYPLLKKEARKIMGPIVKIISQDEIVPKKLKLYLKNHREVSGKLSKNKTFKIIFTGKTKNTNILAKKWFGKLS